MSAHFPSDAPGDAFPIKGVFAFSTFAVRLQQSPTVRERRALQRLPVVRRISVSPTSCMTDPHRGPRSIVFKPPQMRGLFAPSLSTPHIHAHASSPTAATSVHRPRFRPVGQCSRHRTAVYKHDDNAINIHASGDGNEGAAIFFVEAMSLPCRCCPS